MKKCKVCGVEKELSEFPKNGKHRSGNISYRPDCKSCHAGYKKKKYSSDGHTADRQKAQKKDKYHNDDDYKEKKLKHNRQYISERYANDPEFKKWNDERVYAWKKTEKGRALSAACNSAWRARLRNAESPDNVVQLEKEFRLEMTECAYCQATERLSLDHIYPLSLGGKHSPENWQCLCIHCNSSKSDRILSK